jgi:hypothetical protein
MSKAWISFGFCGTFALLAVHALAEDAGMRPDVPRTGEIQQQTLKERLGDKASDEQRVDNCKVPPDRRGPKIRRDNCDHASASPSVREFPGSDQAHDGIAAQYR